MDFDQEITIRLLSGHAELFGTELAPQQPYTFSGTKSCIYTHVNQGCSLSVSPELAPSYTAEENPHMTAYVNLHFALEAKRNAVISSHSHGDETNGASNGDSASLGPRVLVVGPENAGKTSLVKLLTAYATRMGRVPTVINLDPREGILTIPGTLTATQFAGLLDVEEGWGNSPMSGPSEIPVKLPLVYPFLMRSPEEDPKHFRAMIRRMALAIQGRFAEDQEAQVCGCFIDTSGMFANGKGEYDLIQHCVSEFNVDTILTIGSERLYSDVSKRFSKGAAVVKLPRSGGCVDRDDRFMRQLQEKKIKQYFFGDPRQTLSPHTSTLQFDQVQVWQYRAASTFLESLLPGGMEDAGGSEVETAVEKIFDKVQPSAQMQSCFLAIVNAQLNDRQEALRDATVMGWIYVIEVDEAREKLRVLAPISGRLPSKPLLWGKWPEAMVSLTT